MGETKRTVVVVAPATLAGNSIVHLVATSSTEWACRHVLPSDLRANALVLQSASAVVVAVDLADETLLASLLPPNAPVIACGPTPPALLRTTSWVKRPGPAILSALLADMTQPQSVQSSPPEIAIAVADAPPQIESVSPSSSSGMWRRKSDMIIGRSVAIQRVLDALDRFASSPAAVSVTGESGTGKELVARALHYTGPRARAPFIALNCAAIPENLFEAELFGYMRGAFTGAVSNRVGAFEAADGGTLFLDEVGEMPRNLQPKLLRVLERGEITRLGSNESRKVAVRVVTATNRSLEEEVRAGNFRQDLYYRLHVCHVHIPPLRERTEDVAPLVAHHLSIIAAREKRPAIPRLSSGALEKLLTYSWPGNVRELVNVLEAAVLLASGNVIEAEHLQLAGSPTGKRTEADEPAILPYRDAKARFEMDYYTRLLRASRGNVSLASKLAQKTRKEVYDALRRNGLEPEKYRDDEAS